MMQDLSFGKLPFHGHVTPNTVTDIQMFLKLFPRRLHKNLSVEVKAAESWTVCGRTASSFHFCTINLSNQEALRHKSSAETRAEESGGHAHFVKSTVDLAGESLVNQTLPLHLKYNPKSNQKAIPRPTMVSHEFNEATVGETRGQ